MKKSNHNLRVGVFGHGKSTHLTENMLGWVRDFGESIALNKAILYTGGGGGLMLAARQGCLKEGGSVVSVNPEMGLSQEEVDANFLGHVLTTGQGKLGRVHLLTQSIDIGFAFGGGAGTLLEIIACYLLAKPVLVVDGFQKKSDPQLLNLLNGIEEKIIEGHKIWSGTIDGKDTAQVFPVHVCQYPTKPADVFSIGKSIHNLCEDKRHDMQ